MRNKYGFTLVEISIVLVVISAIIAGVVIGQSMLQAARLRETMADYDRYVKAIKEFQDKYYALPGDMPNAVSFWGAQAGGTSNGYDATCAALSTAATDAKTCNGDGNGSIGDSDIDGSISVSSVNSTLSNQHEWFRAWQQLANAGFINGQFTGVHGSEDLNDAEIGSNVPRTPLKKKSGWTLLYYLHVNTDNTLWGDQYGHILVLGGETDSISSDPVLKVAEAKMIDDKIDDGKPGRGYIRSFRSNVCTNDDLLGVYTQDTTEYSGTTDNGCALVFITGF